MTTSTQKFFRKQRDLIVIALMVLLVVTLYWQVAGFGFVNLDDNKYVYENPAVLSGLNRETISWAFSTFFFSNWHPITWLSHQLDISLFGLDPGAHHATNLVLHIINTLLALEFFRRLTGSFWKSAVVAVFFAVHPLHVESVAWVSERKDLLSTLFWLLAMHTYLGFARPGKYTESIEEKDGPGGDSDDGRGEGSPLTAWTSKPYIIALALFALGLMSKPMVITLPFVLLLLDYWPLDRLKRLKDVIPLAAEKVPFFVLSIASGVVTIIAQGRGGAVRPLEAVSVWSRIANAAVSYVTYCYNLFYPLNLSALYPYDHQLPAWKIIGSFVLLAAISGICLSQTKHRKYLLIGWLWFVGTLVPVIGLVQVGAQSHADRYTYVPYFGLFMIVVWGGAELLKFLKINKTVSAVLPVILILLLSIISFRQIGIWKNSETLLTHSISITKDNYLLAQNLCSELTKQNRLREAEIQCRASIASNEKYYLAYASLGNIQVKQKKFPLAEKNFKKALEMGPGADEYLINLATSQSLQGKPFEAEANLKKAASRISPKQFPQIWTSALYDLARAFELVNKYDKASENYGRALSIAPARTDLRAMYALNLYKAEKNDDAEKQIEIVLRQVPNQAEAHDLKGRILLAKKDKKAAIAAFERALELNPDLESAKKNLEELK